MTSIDKFAETGTNDIVGLKVAASKNVIGSVTSVVKTDDDKIQSVNVRKDRDSTMVAVHQNRIAGVDEEKGVLVIN
jgi:hypothetical protein